MPLQTSISVHSDEYNRIVGKPNYVNLICVTVKQILHTDSVEVYKTFLHSISFSGKCLQLQMWILGLE